MPKLIKNRWSRAGSEPFLKAEILRHADLSEGLDVCRLRFTEAGSFTPRQDVAHIISVIRGRGQLHISPSESPLAIEAGVHFYLPPGGKIRVQADASMELVSVSAPSSSQSRGQRFILRDETFVAACATKGQSLRWILTPQYLSRRVFLHHDPVLLSKSGHPVSWFRTTMFDVAGLPTNDEGESVFKMSYNSRTEFNVCYEVTGDARVRMAEHPYRDRGQSWGSWLALDGDSTYHLNEAANGPEEESVLDPTTGIKRSLRNKHEVYAKGGSVSLFCLFDPAPAGVERHRPGAYSDYEPLSEILGTRAYAEHQKSIAAFDEMVDLLSLAKAQGKLDAQKGSAAFELYEEGLKTQRRLEAELLRVLAAEGQGRDRMIERWTSQSR